MRHTRKLPPTMEELQKDFARQQRLKVDVAELERAYQEEKAAVEAEAQKVAQLNAPNQKQKQPPYPTQSNPSIVPAGAMSRTHPPSQEYGASIPRSKPDETSFPSIAQDTPERHQMAAALDATANIKLGKAEKERQLGRQGKAETCGVPADHTILPLTEAVATRAQEPPRHPDAPATPADTFKPEDWKPVSRR